MFMHCAGDILEQDVARELSPKEREVIACLARGESNKEIARRMHLSARTVEGYRASILKKAGARNVTDLLRRIFGQGSPTQA